MLIRTHRNPRAVLALSMLILLGSACSKEDSGGGTQSSGSIKQPSDLVKHSSEYFKKREAWSDWAFGRTSSILPLRDSVPELVDPFGLGYPEKESRDSLSKVEFLLHENWATIIDKIDTLDKMSNSINDLDGKRSRDDERGYVYVSEEDREYRYACDTVFKVFNYVIQAEFDSGRIDGAESRDWFKKVSLYVTYEWPKEHLGTTVQVNKKSN